ncbi:MAG: MBL fold metallo-hydrolase [Anaerolineae bacterium]|nr:MBL fold metallo-hydrolase [Anaerolineae bacterium]
MTLEVNIITTPFILNTPVNCYLVRVGDGFILIDTAKAGKRATVEKALESAGCRPGNLKLIILTHGDFDHCGNAAYLREKFGAKIAMHDADSGIVEHGDMFQGRAKPNVLVKAMSGLFFRLGKPDRFKPDLLITEGYNFSEYGFDAKVLHLPGHSKGHIGILTAGGDLFCGDLLANTNKPEVWSLVDDPAAMNASVERLRSFEINTVYPGHGKPFSVEQFTAARR